MNSRSSRVLWVQICPPGPLRPNVLQLAQSVLLSKTGSSGSDSTSYTFPKSLGRLIRKAEIWSREMVQQGKVLATKTDTLRSIPGPSHWKKTVNSHKVSSDLHMCALTYILMHTHKLHKVSSDLHKCTMTHTYTHK